MLKVLRDNKEITIKHTELQLGDKILSSSGYVEFLGYYYGIQKRKENLK